MSAIRWKFTAGCALFALVVAGLSSLIGGNPAGTTVVRALVAAVLFGAAGTAARMAVASFLPELEQLLVGAGAEDESEGESPGAGVDIVVDDDEGEPLNGFASEDDGEPAAELSGEDDELADGDDGNDRGHDAASRPGDDLVAEAEPVETAESEYPDPTDSIDPSGVDRLPDVGGFADSFDAPESVTTSDGAGSQGGSSDHDPAVMARALQTMLKRDA